MPRSVAAPKGELAGFRQTDDVVGRALVNTSHRSQLEAQRWSAEKAGAIPWPLLRFVGGGMLTGKRE